MLEIGTQGFARGESYEKLTTQIGKRFIDVAKRDIYRLVYTEGTYIMAESSAKPFEEDFESYRLSTVGDGKVCSKCNGTAESVFRFADREAGVNFPPIHPMCRCTFEIVVDDWNKWLDDYEKKHSDSGKQLMNRLKANDNDDILNSISSRGKAIDDASLNSVSKVKIPDLNEKQNHNIYINRQRLLEELVDKPVGIEGSVIVPLKSDDVFDVRIGKEGKTGIDDFNDVYYAIHNHPNSDVLSPGDLIGFLNRPMMFGIEALGNNGKTIFLITKTFDPDVIGYMEYIYKELDSFKLSNPELDTYKDYELIKDFSEKLLEKGTEYGFKIIK